MLLDLRKLVSDFGLHVTGCVHGGAHLAEEALMYHSLDIRPVFWIEANPEVIPKIRKNLVRYDDNHVIQALLLDRARDDVTFRVTNYDGMSSSVFPWGTHTQFSPDTVHVGQLSLRSTTLDDLDAEFHFDNCNLLNLDLEGAELLALQGATELLKRMDYLYLEVRVDEVYQNAPLVSEVDRFLTDFVRVETGLVDGQGWGDALYIRR